MQFEILNAGYVSPVNTSRALTAMRDVAEWLRFGRSSGDIDKYVVTADKEGAAIFKRAAKSRHRAAALASREPEGAAPEATPNTSEGGRA